MRKRRTRFWATFVATLAVLALMTGGAAAAEVEPAANQAPENVQVEANFTSTVTPAATLAPATNPAVTAARHVSTHDEMGNVVRSNKDKTAEGQKNESDARDGTGQVQNDVGAELQDNEGADGTPNDVADEDEEPLNAALTMPAENMGNVPNVDEAPMTAALGETDGQRILMTALPDGGSHVGGNLRHAPVDRTLGYTPPTVPPTGQNNMGACNGPMMKTLGMGPSSTWTAVVQDPLGVNNAADRTLSVPTSPADGWTWTAPLNGADPMGQCPQEVEDDELDADDGC